MKSSSPSCRNCVIFLLLGSIAMWMTIVEAQKAHCVVDFDGTDEKTTIETLADLGDSPLTIEAWLKCKEPGASASARVREEKAFSLVIKEAGDAGGSDQDKSRVLGIRAWDDVLRADPENMTLCGDRPVAGIAPIVDGRWHYLGTTYDGSKWCSFPRSISKAEQNLNQRPRWSSIQHGALTAATMSSGSVVAFLDELLDEACLRDYAPAGARIRAILTSPVSALKACPVGGGGFIEEAGTAVSDSSAGSVESMVTGANWSWGPYPSFNMVINEPFDPPTLNAPLDMATDVHTSPTLYVTISDSDDKSLTVTFYGRVVSAAGADFALIGLPDTQYYTCGYFGGSPAIFKAQTQWVVDHLDSLNIVYVAHVGDCVENGDSSIAEWQGADTAMSILETVMSPDGVPFGVAVGNHDQTPAGGPAGTTTYYNQFFGESRFSGRRHYGGHYGSSNDNHYQLFSASGLHFIVVYMEYDNSPDAAVLDWADSLFSVHSTRRGIVVSHRMIGSGDPARFLSQGQAIYNALKDNPNLFLMLCGHVSGEGKRSDVYNGQTVYTLMADYQDRPHGGDGWLRIMEFSPADDQIRVRTYSPTLDSSETDANSQFTLWYDMEGTDFAIIGTNTEVPSGSNTTMVWSGLDPLTEYEWYVEVSNGMATTNGPVWSFTTGVFPPRAVSGLSIRATFDSSGGGSKDIRLIWSPVTADTAGGSVTVDTYVVYRDTIPVFTPGSSTELNTTSDITHLDVAAAGNSAINYFYYVNAWAGTLESANSKCVGVFDRDLGNSPKGGREEVRNSSTR